MSWPESEIGESRGVSTLTPFDCFSSSPADGTASVVLSSQPDAEQQVLTLHLAAETMLLPLDQLIGIEAVTLGQILPVPGMTVAVMGAYEWRQEVVWVVDLGMLVDLSPLTQQPSLSTLRQETAFLLVLQTETLDLSRPAQTAIGVVVLKIGNIETIPTERIRHPAPGIFNPRLQAILRGYDPRSGLPILDGRLLLRRFLFHHYPTV